MRAHICNEQVDGFDQIQSQKPNGTQLTLTVGQNAGFCLKEGGKNLIKNSIRAKENLKMVSDQVNKVNRMEIQDLFDVDTKKYKIYKESVR